MKLYEIKNTYLDFLARMESGEIPEEAVQDTLEGLEGVFEEKADNIACLIKTLNAEASAIKTERDTLYERQKAKEKEAERLKAYLAGAMKELGKGKLETARNALSFRKSQRLVVDKEFAALLSEDEKAAYLRYKEPEIDKKAVTNALKAGVAVPGAVLEEQQNLQIK